MKTALIGYTGFVGANLAQQRSFEYLYNSKNSIDMIGQCYDEVVCAGVSAVKWQANKNPQDDMARIRALMEVLGAVQAERFILISTVDVYPDPTAGADESFDCHSGPNHAYGAHRLAFEDFCREKFPNIHVVRLPGLFGKGLKKNILFDLLHDNQLEAINPHSSYQYYDLNRLWPDIVRVISAQLRLINFVTEPVPTSMILDGFFPDKRVGQSPAPEAHYDIRTARAGAFEKAGPYLYTRAEVMSQMQDFIRGYWEGQGQ